MSQTQIHEPYKKKIPLWVKGKSEEESLNSWTGEQQGCWILSSRFEIQRQTPTLNGVFWMLLIEKGCLSSTSMLVGRKGSDVVVSWVCKLETVSFSWVLICLTNYCYLTCHYAIRQNNSSAKYTWIGFWLVCHCMKFVNIAVTISLPLRA